MNNLISGIILITSCATGYYFSWRCYIKGNYKVAILLLLICGLILRIYTSLDLYLHSWDERYHALVAKNIINHPLTPTLYDNPLLPYDYKSWISNHIWLHKQPLPLWSMAASMWLFGESEISLRLPSILLSTAGIWLTFATGSYFFSRKNGFIAALLYSINGLIIELTGGRTATDHIDIFFLFFVGAAVVCSIQYIKKQRTFYNILAGVCIGAAILSKWLPALIVLPVWLLIVMDSNKFRTSTIILQFFIMVTCCTITFLPWQIYIHNFFPAEAQWESSFNIRHFTEVLEGQSGPFYYFIDKIRINYGEIMYLPIIWFTYKTIFNAGNKKNIAVLTWFIIPVIFFSISRTKMQAYILFTSPAIFMMASEFYLALKKYKENHKFKWVMTIIMLLIIILPARYTIERIKPFNIAEKPQWSSDLKNLNNKKNSRGVLFNYSRPVEAMFYTSLTAYPQIPEEETIKNLINKNYTVLIDDNGNIPVNIKKIKGIKLINLAE